MPLRAFILQPTYRILHRKPVIHLWGIAEDGGKILIRDRRPVPHFYVREQDAARAAELGASPLAPTESVTFAGEPVVRAEVSVPPETPAVRDRLHEAGIATFEADVRFAMRYLMQRGIQGGLEIEGDCTEQAGFGRVFDEPELRPARFRPKLSVLSFDIETDPKAQRLLSISLVGCGASEVLLFTPEGWHAPPEARNFPSEKALYEAFCERVRELDPDVLTGWNVNGFDFPVLERIGRRCGSSLRLGRDGSPARIPEPRSSREQPRVVVTGRTVLDGVQLLRGSFVRMERYSLDFVAREVLGEGKTLQGDDRGGAILRLFKEDRPRLVEYNLRDSRLALEILEELGLVELSVERSLLTGLPPDRVSGSIAAFDFLYLTALHRKGFVAPSVGSPGRTQAEGSFGGHLIDPQPGFHENVLVFDFKSLYPSIIRTFQIDPLGYVSPEDSVVGAGAPEDLIRAPGGALLRREPGILPGLLDELFPRREDAKRRGDATASQAIKILMNSFYGVLGTTACRFYNPHLANAITSFGRELLEWCRRRAEELGFEVLYGDTDSLFIAAERPDAAAAWEAGRELGERLNRDLAAHVRETWRVESRLELELETLYLRLFLPALRGGKGGAHKRYVGLVEDADGGEPEVVFTGMESVRRDTTELAKEVQRELYRRFFADRPVEDYLRGVVDAVRAGERDDALVYRKALRKDPSAYTATSPPHVVAARKMKGKPGRLIHYVITVAGPEPAEERESGLDYEHYIAKQIQPIAEPILTELGLEFAKVVGDDRQLGLF